MQVYHRDTLSDATLLMVAPSRIATTCTRAPREATMGALYTGEVADALTLPDDALARYLGIAKRGSAAGAVPRVITVECDRGRFELDLEKGP